MLKVITQPMGHEAKLKQILAEVDRTLIELSGSLTILKNMSAMLDQLKKGSQEAESILIADGAKVVDGVARCRQLIGAEGWRPDVEIHHQGSGRNPPKRNG